MKLSRIQKLKSAVVLTVRDTVHTVQQAQILLAASSLAYTSILSIIPLLAVSFSLFKAFGGLEKVYSTLEPVVLKNLAQGTNQETVAQLRQFISNIHAGRLGAGGLIALIVTCMSLLFSAEKTINRIWNAPMTRSLFQRASAYWLFITLGPLGLSVALGAGGTNGIPFTRWLPSGTGGILTGTLLLACIYKWVPHRKVHNAAAILPAFLISIALAAAQRGYQLYTSKVLTYNKIYGSLAAVPIILFWIYILWALVLFGAALSSAVHRRLESP